MTRDQTILVVNENDQIRSALAFLLKVNDYSFVEASCVEEAMQKASRESIGLILIDLDKPLHDGLAAGRRIRKRAERPDVPILVVDGAAPGGRAGEITRGHNEYIIKLIDLDQLVNILSYILHQYSDAA